MGVDTVLYVVYGVILDDLKDVQTYFDSDFDEGPYDDNTYREEISITDSGLHIISDGMNGRYVIFGKIISKGLDSLPLSSFKTDRRSASKIEKTIAPHLSSIPVFSSKADLEYQFIVLTHFH
jgi:hypothetical protein